MSDEAKIVLKDGTVIKITGGKDKKYSRVSIYNGDYKNENDHSSIHINVSSEDNKSYINEHDLNHSNSTNTDLNCFLTTACIRYCSNNFNDDCYVLNVLRWFRDFYVPKKDIEYYYKIAPAIVLNIDNSLNSSVVYDYIYENLVEYCVTAIENGNYDLAYNRYKNMVSILEKNFGQDKLSKKLIKK